MPKGVPKEPGAASRADARQIQKMFNLLDLHFDVPAMAYKDGWSDARVAREVLAQEGSVERYRVKFYGRLKGTAGQGIPGRVQRLEDQINAMLSLLEHVTSNAPQEVRDMLASTRNPPTAQTPAPSNADLSKQVDFERAAIALLTEVGKPMQPAEIKDGLFARGYFLEAKNINSLIGQKLLTGSKIVGGSNRKKDSTRVFIRLEGHGWWLRDKPYKPADYVPK